MKTYSISKNGQITLPVKIRKKLNLKAGTKILFIERDSNILIKPINKYYFYSLIGITNTNGKSLKSLMKEKINNNF